MSRLIVAEVPFTLMSLKHADSISLLMQFRMPKISYLVYLVAIAIATYLSQ
jgi:hypothetical protein